MIVHYNYRFMRAICLNMEYWEQTPRAIKGGMMKFMNSADDTQLYGFDMKSASTGPRGDAQCPCDLKVQALLP